MTLSELMMFPQDKANHFVWGAIIFAVVALVLGSISQPWAHMTSFAAAVAAAALREALGGTRPDLADFLFTIAGAGTVWTGC